MSKRKELPIPLVVALVPIFFLIIALVVTLRIYKGDPHIPILATAVVAAVIGDLYGTSWKKMEEGIAGTLRVASPAILILLIVGMIIGTWILAGIVPALIYYGLKILSPGFFLPTTALICCIVSLATGSSWTTAGTVGIALMGVGQGFGIPLPMVAGAIISGAYFGDKMSPLSDTTNLAPVMAGSTLFDHIRHMIYTTLPSLTIALVLYYFLGHRYAANQLDTQAIANMLTTLETTFEISPWLLLPPVLVIVIIVLRTPAIPGLILGTIMGGVWAAGFQHTNLGAIIQAAHYGFIANTGLEAVDKLLTRGGLNSMMWTVSLIICAMCLAGVLESTGLLKTLTSALVKLARNTGSLVLTTICACIGTNLVAGDQYLSIVIPGRLFKPLYRQQRLKPKNLSRALEDAGTLSSPLVPWNTCGAFMYTTLGVYPFAYLPYAFLNLINPLVSVFYGFTGITMERFSADDQLLEGEE